MSASAKPAARPAVNTLQTLFDSANRLRGQQAWPQAAAVYERLAQQLKPGTPAWASVLHNGSLCLYATKQYEAAAAKATAAFEALPALWQAGLLGLNALKALQRHDAYAALLQAVYAKHPQQPRIAVAHATWVMNYLGDAKRARDLIAPWLQHPDVACDAQALGLMTRLYDRDPDDTPSRLSADIQTFADQYLTLPGAETPDVAADVASDVVSCAASESASSGAEGRQRVGIISNLLNASPVHAFGFSHLKSLAEAGHVLVIINRGRQNDWATEQFRSIAAQWVDVVGLDAESLHQRLRALNLDVLYEMAGWMDVDVLKAVSVKPARRLIKWVGGQSCTTGLRSFDGFVTDAEQTPDDTAHLYSEPLLLRPASYVTYTPPPTVQQLANAAVGRQTGTWGVVANPLKLSRAFLQWLSGVGGQPEARIRVAGGEQTAVVQRLVLMDKRYARPAVRQRVEGALRPAWGDRLQFVTPADHLAFMQTAASFDGLIDTFPYSCGLTMAEGLFLGLQVAFPPVDRHLFSERHGVAHWAHWVARARGAHSARASAAQPVASVPSTGGSAARVQPF